MSCRVVETPVCRLLLAATDCGVARIAFESEDFAAVHEALAERFTLRDGEVSPVLDQCVSELTQYFHGERQTFSAPLDHTLSSGFRLRVQRALPRITYGKTGSYAELAQLVGSPKAARAVGTACATNPLPIVLPCHRVLRSDGSLGGYAGGLGIKTALLDLERRSALQRRL